MNIEEIRKLNKNELIQYAQEFNIWKTYTFQDYIKTKEVILEQMTKYDVKEEEIYPVRIAAVDSVITTTTYK
jgi:hypothetical protein